MKKLVLSLMLLCLGSMIDSNARIVEITSKNAFDQEIAQEQVTVVAFWADWCGPCKLMLHMLPELNDKFDYDAVCFAKCDVDASYGAELAQLYNVIDLPTFLFYKDGVLEKRVNGLIPQEELEEIIMSLL
ncbi:MAG: thioredoxin family protein [Bacteroidetes bacterium]|uniref:Thioredoxin family protein n=1 Tax=Candidatus Cryptobacteroides faecigallinarum TaxID=2840763 RepID=A0A9D9NIC8_9BACT|nr:thioredoxin family protein [Candidatus Cryptobacteroides faecigallinarum]